MKKIIHVIDSLAIGGAEQLVVNVINSLDGEYEQHLALLHPPTTLVTQLPASCKVTMINFTSRSPLRLLSAVRKLKRYMIDNKIEIAHSQLYWSHIITRLAANKKIKVFNTLQAISSESMYKGRRLYLHIEKLTYKRRHHIIGVSKEVLKDFDEWVGLRGPSTVIYNAIDDKFFTAGPKTSFSVNELKMVAVGNLRYQKNYPYVIEAFKQMPPNVSLDVYGEGDMRAELQAAIDTHKLNIKLCGHHRALETVLPSYDVLLMPSFYEGFSLGLMEAMAAGLPAILSEIPVLAEAGADSAIYVDINNPSDLVDKVNKILEGKIMLAPLAQKAYTRARALAKKETHIQKLRELYK